jgi:hypothetical protein
LASRPPSRVALGTLTHLATPMPGGHKRQDEPEVRPDVSLLRCIYPLLMSDCALAS